MFRKFQSFVQFSSDFGLKLWKSVEKKVPERRYGVFNDKKNNYIITFSVKKIYLIARYWFFKRNTDLLWLTWNL
jgi:hypothetical protein